MFLTAWLEVTHKHGRVRAKGSKLAGQSGGNHLSFGLHLQTSIFQKIQRENYMPFFSFPQRLDLRLQVVFHCSSNHKDSFCVRNAKLRLSPAAKQAAWGLRSERSNHPVAHMVCNQTAKNTTCPAAQQQAQRKHLNFTHPLQQLKHTRRFSSSVQYSEQISSSMDFSGYVSFG